MEGRRDDRHSFEPGGSLQPIAVRFLDTRYGRLQRCVPGLHDPTGRRIARVRPPFHRHNEVDATRPQPEIDGGRVYDHGVPDLHRTREIRVRDGRLSFSADVDLDLDGSGAAFPDTDDSSP